MSVAADDDVLFDVEIDSKKDLTIKQLRHFLPMALELYVSASPSASHESIQSELNQRMNDYKNHLIGCEIEVNSQRWIQSIIKQQKKWKVKHNEMLKKLKELEEIRSAHRKSTRTQAKIDELTKKKLEFESRPQKNPEDVWELKQKLVIAYEKQDALIRQHEFIEKQQKNPEEMASEQDKKKRKRIVLNDISNTITENNEEKKEEDEKQPEEIKKKTSDNFFRNKLAERAAAIKKKNEEKELQLNKYLETSTKALEKQLEKDEIERECMDLKRQILRKQLEKMEREEH